MYSLFFTLVFQGLSVLAVICLVRAVMPIFSFLPTSLSDQLTRFLGPVLTTVVAITPSIVPRRLLYPIAALWLVALRVALYLTAGAYGFLPAVAS